MSNPIKIKQELLDKINGPSVDDLIDELNTANIWERSAVNTIREQAGHHFESDGFDMGVAEDAVATLERDHGVTPAFWLTTETVVEDIREWFDDRVRINDYGGDTSRPTAGHVAVATVGHADSMSDELLLIGEGAVVQPPAEVPQTIPLVRHPDGVAHYEV